MGGEAARRRAARDALRSNGERTAPEAASAPANAAARSGNVTSGGGAQGKGGGLPFSDSRGRIRTSTEFFPFAYCFATRRRARF